MGQFSEFFEGLFSTDLWPARWHCGYWSDFHGWLYIISDLTIWFSYFAIPVIIIGYIARKKYELKYTRTYFLFAAFILLCGSTHFIDAVMFWTPLYRVNAVIRFATAVVSLFTVYHLMGILPEAFRGKTSLVLEGEIARRLVVERQLEEANQGLRAFASVAAHDLKEPLRKINMYTSQLNEANEEKLDTESQQYIEKTLLATVRMNKLIEDVLNLYSLVEPVLVHTDLNEVLKQCESELELKISTSGAIIESDPLPTVLGHRGYLLQVFCNLIGNALKFCDKKPVINITTETKGDTVLVHVRDNGIGMEQSATKKIFVPFERLHSKTTYEGSGLGLSIVKRIMEIHKGDIDVVSAPGEGTTFTMSFPVTW